MKFINELPYYNSLMNITHMSKAFVEEALKRGWHLVEAKCGREGAQSLLAHSLNSMSIAYRIGHLLKWPESKVLVVVASRAVHDIAKKRWKCGHERPPKGMTEEEEEEAKEILKAMGLSGDYLRKALALAQKDEVSGGIVDAIAGLKHEAVEPDLVDLAMLADRLASTKDPSETPYEDTKRRLERLGITVAHHKVSVVRGISTYLLHKALMFLYERNGFHPVLYFPSGIIYIGKGEHPSFTKEELLESLRDALKKFVVSRREVIGRAAMGIITQKPVKAPEYVFIDEKTAENFWIYAIKQKVIRDPTVKRSDHGERGFGSILPENLELGEIEASIKFYKGMKNLLAYMNSLLRASKEFGIDNPEKIAKESFKKIFSEEMPESVLRVANTTPNVQAKEIIDELSETIGLEGWNLEAALDKMKRFLIEMTKDLVRNLKEDPMEGFGIEELLDDLIYPITNDPLSLAEKRFDTYKKGKAKAGTLVCPICGKQASVRGVAAMHGEGVEGFSNLLEGGSRVGGSNKLNFCKLCDLEAKLRALIIEGWNKGDILFLVPMINSSPEMRLALWEETQMLLRKVTGTFGLFNERAWADAVLGEKLNEGVAIIWKSIFSSMSPNRVRRVIRKIAGIIENEHKTLERAIEWYKIDASDFEELAYKLLERGEIPEEILDELEEGSGTYLLVTENYTILFLNKKIAARLGRDEESETSASLRKLFYALLFSRIMQASAIYAPIPLSVLSIDLKPQGYVRIPRMLGAREALKRLGIWDEEWVLIPKADNVLKRVASLIKVHILLLNLFGKDGLLSIAKSHPGKVLTRASSTRFFSEKISKKSRLDLLRCLEMYWGW